jgi:hypothetical protein
MKKNPSPHWNLDKASKSQQKGREKDEVSFFNLYGKWPLALELKQYKKRIKEDWDMSK